MSISQYLVILGGVNLVGFFLIIIIFIFLLFIKF